MGCLNRIVACMGLSRTEAPAARIAWAAGQLRGHQQLCQVECCGLQSPEALLPHHHRNPRAGFVMPHQELPPELLQDIRTLAAGWGKIVARRAFGEQGPGLDVDFDTMEQLSHAAASGLIEGALGVLLEQQAQDLGQQQPCPQCGTPCQLRRQPRDLVTPGLTLTHNEPFGYCPACRRDFFPPTAAAAPG